MILKKVHISRGGVKANSEKVHNFFFFFLDPSLTNPKSSPISSRLKGAAGCAPDRSTGRLWLAWTLTKPNPASVTKPNQTSRYIQLYCFR